MRILIANEGRSGGGGVESYLSALIEPLRRAGHDVALLYANPSAETGPTTIETERSWSVADLGAQRALEEARAWKPDVCFANNMRYLDVDEAIAVSWPTVKMMHAYSGACLSGHKAFSLPELRPCTRVCGPGCLVHYLPRRCGRLRPAVMMQEYGWARRQQRLLPRYRAIVVASDHMHREYSRYGYPAARIHTIPYFVEHRAISDSGRDLDVLFLGRMTPLKGAHVLLDAMQHAVTLVGRPLTAVLAGEGPERASLDARARELAADRRLDVKLPGWLDAAARDRLLARTRVLAVPSRWPEPFGLVGLEAGAHGAPSVAFDVGGISMWLDHGVNGLLIPPSAGAEGFGTALASVLSDTALHTRLAAGARNVALRFSADANVAALTRVLSECRSPGTS